MKNAVIDPEKVTRIFKTATGIFGQQGFIKSKTGQIANQVQVSEGLLFHYFGNKQALYLDAFRHAYYQIYDHTDPKEWQNAPDLAAMIATAVRHGLKLQFKFPVGYRLVMRAYTDLPYFLEPLR